MDDVHDPDKLIKELDDLLMAFYHLNDRTLTVEEKIEISTEIQRDFDRLTEAFNVSRMRR